MTGKSRKRIVTFLGIAVAAILIILAALFTFSQNRNIGTDDSKLVEAEGDEEKDTQDPEQKREGQSDDSDDTAQTSQHQQSGSSGTGAKEGDSESINGGTEGSRIRKSDYPEEDSMRTADNDDSFTSTPDRPPENKVNSNSDEIPDENDSQKEGQDSEGRPDSGAASWSNEY